ncbi:MurR/RpiR family transcriptional regulator [Virgibacillus sp. C22-A2]|uniref:MurR/RpiR family transcriptional regulator n=1 Tax=Virgibacillus tibetensis TaxID=3042313 RepID=A0ABU6KCV6_9BACI|nr:MurR/RpiR family transcriptional regulator [Virgibacillus sp. C22-A2]
MTPNYINKTEYYFPTLTKGLKKVANSLLSDPMIFATHPAKKVGEIIGVSETMVIRLCHSIGYTGYSTLQKEVRTYLLELNNESFEVAADQIEATNRYALSMQKDISNLKNNIDKLDVDQLNEFVETIINSEKVVIAGYYHSFTFAHWFSFNLNYILRNSSLYRPETDAGLLDLLPEKSCIVVFSFYRYALDTIRLAEEAKEKGIKVLTITDSRVAPVTEVADIIIPITISPNNLLSKGPVTLSFINSILFEIIQRVEERGVIHSTFKYFIEDGEDKWKS